MTMKVMEIFKVEGSEKECAEYTAFLMLVLKQIDKLEKDDEAKKRHAKEAFDRLVNETLEDLMKQEQEENE